MSATLSANSNISGTSYQWQVSTNNGANWANIIPSTKYVGTQTANLAIKNVLLNLDNSLYRCNVSSACNSVYSNVSTLRVTSSPIVTQQPSDILTPLNSVALFDVIVSNPSNCVYQWQINTTGTTWTNLTDNTNIAGSTTNELVVSAISTYQNKKFRCKLKSSCSSTFKYSNAALLSIGTGSTNSSGPSSFKMNNEQEEGSILEEALLSNDFSLYPNPANNTIYLDYATETTSHIEITMFDMLGQIVETIENNNFENGNHSTEFNTTNIKNGTYLIMITSKSNTGKVSQLHKRLIINH